MVVAISSALLLFPTRKLPSSITSINKDAVSSVVEHFRKLNAERGKLTIRERLFDAVLESIWRNTGNLGTGMVLILSGQAMRQRAFDGGDFRSSSTCCKV
jgi:hypothetical protein